MGRKLVVGDFVDVPEWGGGVRVREGYCCVIDDDGTIVEFDPYDPDRHGDIKMMAGQFYIPGFIDTHCHAPQFPNRGLGTDIDLLQWLERYTFPEEKKYADLQYARERYERVVEESLRNGTTCSVYFATVHKEATMCLMDICDEKRQRAYVGKVCMHINSPEDYKDESVEQCIADNQEIFEYSTTLPNVHSVVTPRFAPVCSTQMMRELADFAKRHNLLIQSHISESRGEISWMADLFPGESYAQVYDECGLLTDRTLMAHAVHLRDDEQRLLKLRNTAIAHCPISNYALNSGIANVCDLQGKGILVGLGSDVSGGWTVSMLEVMRMAVIASRSLHFTTTGQPEPLSYADAFHLGTRGSALSIRRPDLGCFQVGCKFDALCIKMEPNELMSVEERFQKYFFCGDDRNIDRIYVNGHALNLGN